MNSRRSQIWVSLGTFVVAVASLGCQRAANLAAEPAQVRQRDVSASATECAVALQQVSAGRDISVNLHCDVPTERKMIEALSNAPWERGCIAFFPGSGFQDMRPELELAENFMSRAGTYWAKYDVSFNVSRLYASAVEELYMNFENLPEDQVAKFRSESPGLFNKASYAHQKYPSRGDVSSKVQAILFSDESIAAETVDAQFDKSKIGIIDVRRRIQYEDGATISDVKVPIMKNGGDYFAHISVSKFIDAYPDHNAERRIDMGSLSCTAKESIELAAFQDLCKMFFERQLLDKDMLWSEGCPTDQK